MTTLRNTRFSWAPLSVFAARWLSSRYVLTFLTTSASSKNIIYNNLLCLVSSLSTAKSINNNAHSKKHHSLTLVRYTKMDLRFLISSAQKWWCGCRVEERRRRRRDGEILESHLHNQWWTAWYQKQGVEFGQKLIRENNLQSDWVIVSVNQSLSVIVFVMC